MGVDLILLPLDHLHEAPAGKYWGFSHTVLLVPRNSDAWPVFEALKPEALPDDHDISSWIGKRVPDGSSKDELMYGRIRGKDCYGIPFTWIAAGKLKPVLERFWPGNPTTAYIGALSDDVMVVLNWH